MDCWLNLVDWLKELVLQRLLVAYWQVLEAFEASYQMLKLVCGFP